MESVTEPTITAVVLCRDVQSPDGDRGGAYLVGALQEIFFLEGSAPYFRGLVYVAFESPGGEYPLAIRWTNETSNQTYAATGSLEVEPGDRAHRGHHPVALYCPDDGWYGLEVEVGGARCRQSIRVRLQ